MKKKQGAQRRYISDQMHFWFGQAVGHYRSKQKQVEERGGHAPHDPDSQLLVTKMAR